MNGIPWWFFSNAGGKLAGKQLTAVDPDCMIARAIPASRAIGCVVYMSCAVEAPGVIRHAAGRRLIVGEPDNRSSQRVARLAKWLRRAGFDCVESTDIRRDIWFKLWGNLSMNPISLLSAATLDRIIADPLTHKLCFRMMEEAGRIGEAIGIPATMSIEEMFDGAGRSEPSRHRCCRMPSMASGRDRRVADRDSRFRPDGRGADAVHRQRSRPRSSEGNQSRPARQGGIAGRASFASICADRRQVAKSRLRQH